MLLSREDWGLPFFPYRSPLWRLVARAVCSKICWKGKTEPRWRRSLKLAPASATILVGSSLSFTGTGGDGNSHW